MSDLGDLLRFLRRLEKHKLSYRLEHNRAESVMVLVAVPGERWEVEFFEGGAVEIERFGSGKTVTADQQASQELEYLFEVFGGE